MVPILFYEYWCFYGFRAIQQYYYVSLLFLESANRFRASTKAGRRKDSSKNNGL